MVQDIGMRHKQLVAAQRCRRTPVLCHADKPKPATRNFMEQDHWVSYS
ncbi:hypothetical protein BOMU111920_22010 [Bordetella muralis]